MDAAGLRLNVVEWGDPSAPPLFLAHGGFDFARTFDVFAPLLAAGGWRVVAWDHRGHGDSEHAALYSFMADMRDMLAVLDSVTENPAPIVGHSKGGAMLLTLAEALPHRVSHVINIDGMPSGARRPDVADHVRTKLLGEELSGWLEHRRTIADAKRRPGTADDLAERRGRMNPRLSQEWLRYLVTVGARQDEDGWRWKIDPALRPGGFGPHRHKWAMERVPGLSQPFILFLGLVPEQMGWGLTAADVTPYLPPGAVLEVFEDAGHFVHIERPGEVAATILEFLRSPSRP